MGHDLHEGKLGVSSTVSEAARREVLDHLLALSRKRYDEELTSGLHDKGIKKSKRTSKSRKKSTGKQEFSS